MKKEFFKVICSLDQTFNSDKFLKLRLKVCHDGLNKNGSHFSIEAIERAKDSICLIPILARVVQDENGDYQFSGHDMTIETNAFDENETKIIYQEVPIGFVPNECNYQILCENNKNYVFVDGYIWKEYSNYAQDIIERDQKINLSMEICVNSQEDISFEDGNSAMDITDFSYTGITLLGNDVEPAMYEACAKLVTFALNKKVSINTMVEELYSLMQTKDEKNNAVNLQDKELSKELNLFNDFFNDNEKILQNMLSLRNTESNKYLLMSTIKDEKEQNYIYYWDIGSKIGYWQKYTVFKDIITFIGEPEIAVFVKNNLLNEWAITFDKLNKEIIDLRKFKDNTIKEKEYIEKINEINKWMELLSDCEDFISLKSNINDFSLEEIQLKCKCIFADIQLKALNNAKNNKENQNDVVNFSINTQIDEEHNSEIDLFVKKFIGC